MHRADLEIVQPLIDEAFDGLAGTVIEISDANQGRGVFSRVLRVVLSGHGDRATRATAAPRSVVVKIPADGANGAAARRSGAYEREALAYRELLPRSPVRTPTAHLVAERSDGFVQLVLEDLTGHRAVDQIDGLDVDDCLRVVAELRILHDTWSARSETSALPVRRATPTTLDPVALTAGLAVVESRWGDAVDRSGRRAFARLVERHDAVAALFADAPDPTLCHGDPRADNLVFDGDTGRPVLFDWQQLALQLGEADVAWLAATSLPADVRHRADATLVSAYGTTLDRYRLGFVLPGLAVLLLAQRDAEDERSKRFIAVSLERIGRALVELDIPSL